MIRNSKSGKEGDYALKSQKIAKSESAKTPGKRKHHRTLFMAVSKSGGALVENLHLPVFNRMKMAKQAAQKVKGRSVRVELSW